MKGLIKKDLLNLSNYKTTIIITTILCSFATITTSSYSFTPIIICSIVGMISISTFNYDEISKSEKYILTLPVTRKEIVASKYLIAVLGVIIGIIIGIILTIIEINILNYLRPENIIKINYKQIIISALSALFSISLIQSIQIPNIYKYGAEKGRVQMFILIFFLILTFLGMNYFITKENINVAINHTLQTMKNFIPYILIILTIIQYMISYKISYNIFKNKDY